MVYYQFVLFVLYVFSTLVFGLAWMHWFDRDNKMFISKGLLLAESFLLGSIFLVAQMLIVSMLGLYRAPVLWGLVALNACVLFSGDLRKYLREVQSTVFRSWSVPKVIFLVLLAWFAFRNCYFLVDVDSHSTYLFAQKLWLEKHTSLFASTALDLRVFVPHFDAVPYALGLSVFGAKGALFAQWVVAFWTMAALSLLYEYTAHRFNQWFALAGVMFVLFNDHIYFSGANNCCVINSAMIALIFAGAYNFYEARSGNTARFALALIFLAHMMGNKYQLAYVFLGVLCLGIFIQKQPWTVFKSVTQNKRHLVFVFLGVFAAGLWYIKNYLATGIPAFPIFADQAGVLNWVPEMAASFKKAYPNPMPPQLILKYFNYLFVWPGIDAAKVTVVLITLMPFILIRASVKEPVDRDRLFEMSYWLAAACIYIAGLALVSFPDPRHYRYGIAVFSYASVAGIYFAMSQAPFLRNKIMIGIVLICLSALQGRIMLAQGGTYKRPMVKDNIGVLMSTIDFDEVISRYYPHQAVARAAVNNNMDKFNRAAWDMGVAGVTPLSSFLLPTRPQVGLWYTTVVRWDSYADAGAIVRDLKENGIDYVMTFQGDQFAFLTSEQYAQKALQYNRFPGKMFYNYGFPAEMAAPR